MSSRPRRHRPPRQRRGRHSRGVARQPGREGDDLARILCRRETENKTPYRSVLYIDRHAISATGVRSTLWRLTAIPLSAKSKVYRVADQT